MLEGRRYRLQALRLGGYGLRQQKTLAEMIRCWRREVYLDDMTGDIVGIDFWEKSRHRGAEGLRALLPPVPRPDARGAPRTCRRGARARCHPQRDPLPEEGVLGRRKSEQILDSCLPRPMLVLAGSAPSRTEKGCLGVQVMYYVVGGGQLAPVANGPMR